MTDTLERPPVAAPATRPGASSPLSGRVALVTGGGSGLGAATDQVLAEAGMDVGIGDGADGRTATSAAITGEGGPHLPPPLDVTDAASARDGIASIVERFGRLDVLINNAGVHKTAGFEELSLEDWDRILAVSLRGPFVMTRAALPALRAS